MAVKKPKQLDPNNPFTPAPNSSPNIQQFPQSPLNPSSTPIDANIRNNGVIGEPRPRTTGLNPQLTPRQNSAISAGDSGNIVVRPAANFIVPTREFRGLAQAGNLGQETIDVANRRASAERVQSALGNVTPGLQADLGLNTPTIQPGSEVAGTPTTQQPEQVGLAQLANPLFPQDVIGQLLFGGGATEDDVTNILQNGSPADKLILKAKLEQEISTESDKDLSAAIRFLRTQSGFADTALAGLADLSFFGIDLEGRAPQLIKAINKYGDQSSKIKDLVTGGAMNADKGISDLRDLQLQTLILESELKRNEITEGVLTASGKIEDLKAQTRSVRLNIEGDIAEIQRGRLSQEFPDLTPEELVIVLQRLRSNK